MMQPLVQRAETSWAALFPFWVKSFIWYCVVAQVFMWSGCAWGVMGREPRPLTHADVGTGDRPSA
jgi:hypothetical protein